MTAKNIALLAFCLAVSTQAADESCLPDTKAGEVLCKSFIDRTTSAPVVHIYDYFSAYVLKQGCTYTSWGDYADWLIRDGEGVASFTTTVLSVKSELAEIDGLAGMTKHVNVVNLDVPNCYEPVNHQHTPTGFNIFVDFTILMKQNSCFRNGDRVTLEMNRYLSDGTFCAERELQPILATIDAKTNALHTEVTNKGDFYHTPNHKFNLVNAGVTQTQMSPTGECEITGNVITADSRTTGALARTIRSPFWSIPVTQMRFEPTGDNTNCILPKVQTLYGSQTAVIPMHCIGNVYLTPLKSQDGASVCGETHYKYSIDTTHVLDRSHSGFFNLITTGDDTENAYNAYDSRCHFHAATASDVADMPVYQAASVHFNHTDVADTGVSKITFRRDDSCSYVWNLSDFIPGNRFYTIDWTQLLAPESCFRYGDVVSMHYEYSYMCSGTPQVFPARVQLYHGADLTIHHHGNMETDGVSIEQAANYCTGVHKVNPPAFRPLVSSILVKTPEFVEREAKVRALELTNGDGCSFYFTPRKLFQLSEMDQGTRACFMKSQKPAHLKVHYLNSCVDTPGEILLYMTPNFQDNKPGQQVEIMLTSSTVLNVLDPTYNIIDL